MATYGSRPLFPNGFWSGWVEHNLDAATGHEQIGDLGPGFPFSAGFNRSHPWEARVQVGIAELFHGQEVGLEWTEFGL